MAAWGGAKIDFDARLMEDAVLAAEPALDALLRLRFRRERDLLYVGGDPEERERGFAAFHHRWFEGLALGAPLGRALLSLRGLTAATRRCLVLPALRSEDESADLRAETAAGRAGAAAAPCGGPTLLIQVRPATLADAASFSRFLDHELLHVADMLDPEFGYRSELPALERGPAAGRQAQERYRVLWDCTIDGRLHRAGRLGDGARARRLGELARHFPELGAGTEAEFRRWFEGPRPRHDDLVRAATEGMPAALSGICPLCRFPYARLHPDPERLSTLSSEAIRTDFPEWTTAAGLCVPCADLYEAAARG